jgi:APA family basic amino acid/polyamine antiporter
VVEAFGRTLFTFSPATMLAVGVVLAISLIHYHSVGLGRRVQNALTVFKIVVILAFALGGLLLGGGDFYRLGEVFTSGRSSVFSQGFAVSLIFVSFAYSGWNAAAYLGGEIKRPGRNIPLALIVGTLIVIGLYLLLNVVYIYALPTDSMAGALDLGVVAGTAMFGPRVGGVAGMVIALALLSVISAMIMAGPRVYYAMSCDGVFFDCFRQVSGSRSTPGRSILLQGGLAVLMILSATFESLLIYIGFTLSLASILTVCGLIKLRITDPGEPRPYRTLGYPLTPLLFLAGNVWIVILGTIAVGAVFFVFLRPCVPGVEQGAREEGASAVSAHGGPSAREPLPSTEGGL